MRTRLPALLLFPGLLALAAEPVGWLVRTWLDPSYDNPGVLVAALVLVLVARSVWSGPGPAPEQRRAFLLLLASACVRLSGRLLAINHLGALALVLDAWAIGLALGLKHRPWPLNPLALAGLFAFALPAEQMIQRVFGQPMSVVSAALAELLLRPFYADLVRVGTFLERPGLRVAIDLPCSGAQGLVLLSGLAFLLLSLRRLNPVLALGLAGLGAVLANTTRIGALVVVPAWIQEPAHSALGLFALELGALPLVLAARWSDALAPEPAAEVTHFIVPPSVAGAFSFITTLIAFAPHHPVDVSGVVEGSPLPLVLGARHGESLPLSEQEREYFQRYGGVVEKRTYDGGEGEFTTLLVRTTAPVRHLHDPALCMAGAGYTVEELGRLHEPLPGTLYRATDPQGRVWRVRVSFYSTLGGRARTGSEAAWTWLRRPGGTWALLERITPWDLCEENPDACRRFELELLRALDQEPLILGDNNDSAPHDALWPDPPRAG